MILGKCIPGNFSFLHFAFTFYFCIHALRHFPVEYSPQPEPVLLPPPLSQLFPNLLPAPHPPGAQQPQILTTSPPPLKQKHGQGRRDCPSRMEAACALRRGWVSRAHERDRPGKRPPASPHSLSLEYPPGHPCNLSAEPTLAAKAVTRGGPPEMRGPLWTLTIGS